MLLIGLRIPPQADTKSPAGDPGRALVLVGLTPQERWNLEMVVIDRLLPVARRRPAMLIELAGTRTIGICRTGPRLRRAH